MSILHCEDCGDFIDTDYGCEPFHGRWVCEKCVDEYPAEFFASITKAKGE